MLAFYKHRLLHLARQHAQSFQQARPFPHVVIDDFGAPGVIREVAAAFPKPDSIPWYAYQNPLERKYAQDQLDLLPEVIRGVLQEMNAPPFLKFLELLTGIPGLIPDPYYRGGGIHQIRPGGKLDLHVDYNIHPHLGLERRLNALLYVNPVWYDSWGGDLEFWEGKTFPAGWGGKVGRELVRCWRRVSPMMNRLVVFATGETSFHGQPDPVTCPEGHSRNALATYYYTMPSDTRTIEPHSTAFVARPTDLPDPDLDALREARAHRRLASNLDVDYLK